MARSRGYARVHHAVAARSSSSARCVRACPAACAYAAAFLILRATRYMAARSASSLATLAMRSKHFCGGAQYERLLSNRFHRHGTTSGLAGLREYRPYAGVQPHLYCTSALAAKTWLDIWASAIMRHLYFGSKANTSHTCVYDPVQKSYAQFARGYRKRQHG